MDAELNFSSSQGHDDGERGTSDYFGQFAHVVAERIGVFGRFCRRIYVVFVCTLKLHAFSPKVWNPDVRARTRPSVGFYLLHVHATQLASPVTNSVSDSIYIRWRMQGVASD